jgi:hypothetical protein
VTEFGPGEYQNNCEEKICPYTIGKKKLDNRKGKLVPIWYRTNFRTNIALLDVQKRVGVSLNLALFQGQLLSYIRGDNSDLLTQDERRTPQSKLFYIQDN